MSVSIEEQRRVADLLEELAAVAVVMEAPPVPDASVVELRPEPQGLSGRHGLLRLVAAAAVVAVVVGGLLVAVRRPDPTAPADQFGRVVVGRIDDFPPGSVTWLPQFGLFVVNDEREGLLALATASPLGRSNCDGILELSVYDPRDNGQPTVPVPDTAFFADTCSIMSWDRLGRLVHGPPSSRGMFRFDTSVDDGWVSMSTDLMRPGERYLWSIGPADPSVSRHGVTDSRALEIETMVEGVATAFANDEASGVRAIVLGAFHDSSTGIVSVPMLLNDAIGELTIADEPVSVGPASRITWDDGQPDHVVARASTESGTAVVLDVVPSVDPVQPEDAQIVMFLRSLVEALP